MTDSVDIVLLDCSGSMGTRNMKTPDGGALTPLDVATHAMRTLLHALNNTGHRVGVVTFPSTGTSHLNHTQVLVQPQLITDATLGGHCHRIYNLNAGGGTPMRSALEEGLRLARAASGNDDAGNKGRVRIHLFTDGLPDYNQIPLRGFPAWVRQEVADTGIRLFTYSIGPDSDCKMLHEMAEASGGVYKSLWSPDMVLTNVINTAVYIRAEPTGQTLPGDAYVVAILAELLEAMVVGAAHGCATACELLRDALDEMRALEHGFAHDIRDQLFTAIQPEHWGKWGEQYTRALLSCMKHRHCGDFKAHCFRHYGDAALQREIENIALVIDAPRGAPVDVQTGRASMAVMVDATGGCFHLAGRIRMPAGATKVLRDLRPGDTVEALDVATGAVGPATVQWVVHSGAKTTVDVRGCLLTPGHPVWLPGRKTFVDPVRHPDAKPGAAAVVDVCNLVLDRGHTVSVDGVLCATLAQPKAPFDGHMPMKLHPDIRRTLAAISGNPHATSGIVKLAGSTI